MRHPDRARRPTGPASLATATLVITVTVLGLSSCSSEGEPEPSQPAATASESSPTSEPGPEIDGDAASFQAPNGFEMAEPSEDSPAVFATGPSGSVVSLVEVGLAVEPPILDRQQEIALDGLGEKFTAEEPVLVDDIEMWHLSGKESKGAFADVYGAVVDGTSVRLTIRLSDEEYDDAERAAVNEQVLASWSWA